MMQNREHQVPSHEAVVHFRPPEELKDFRKEESNDSVRRDRVAAQLVSVFRDHRDVYAMQEARLDPRRRRPTEVDVASQSLKVYLNSISKYKLLTPEDEHDMFGQLDVDYPQIDELSRSNLLPFVPDADQEELITRFVGTHQSIYVSNTRLVISIAKKYFTAAATVSHGPFDMIQDGNIGLNRAINRFDISKGYKFSTYATLWIEQQIQRGIADKSRTVRVPVHENEKIRKVARAKRALETKLERAPTSEELAHETGIDSSKIDFLSQVDEQPTSLSAQAGNFVGAELGDYVPDDRFTHDVDAFSDREQLANLIEEAPLSSAELAVLGLKFGIDHTSVIAAVESLTSHTGTAYTTETTSAIAKVLKVKTARVKELEESALAKLQSLAGVA